MLQLDRPVNKEPATQCCCAAVLAFWAMLVLLRKCERSHENARARVMQRGSIEVAG